MDSFKSVLSALPDRHNVSNRLDRKSPYYLDKEDGLISPPESDSNSVASLDEYTVKPSTAVEPQVDYEGNYKFAPIKVRIAFESRSFSRFAPFRAILLRFRSSR